jgi:hypothetical protein
MNDEFKITLIALPNFKLFKVGLFMFICFFIINFYLYIVAVEEPLWSIILVQLFLLFAYVLSFILRISKAYIPPKIHISRERIEFENGKPFGLKIGPTFFLKADSIGEIKLKFPKKPIVPAIIAEFQNEPRKRLNIATWNEEGKGDWLQNNNSQNEMLYLVNQCPAYQAFVSMGYKVILPL